MSRALSRLTPVLRRQFGVFTTGDAAALGVRRSDIARLRSAGLVERLWRGVYGTTGHPDSWERRWLAALLAAGPRAAISHLAAAHLLGLEHVGAGRRPDLELVRPGGTCRREGGPPTRTARHLRPDDLTRLGPWRLTRPAWTLCSLAHSLDVSRFRRAVDAAVARGAVALDDLTAVASRFVHCPGAPVIRAVLADAVPEVRATRSDAERRLLRLLIDAGLPRPTANLRVTDAAGAVRYLDFAYPDHRIAIEIDVHPDHEGTLGRRADGARQNDLVPEWVPLRFDAWDLDEQPAVVVSQVRRALGQLAATA